MSYHRCAVCMAAGPSRLARAMWRPPVTARGNQLGALHSTARSYSDSTKPGLFSRFKTLWSSASSEDRPIQHVSFKDRRDLESPIDSKLIVRPWESRLDKVPRIDVATNAGVPGRSKTAEAARGEVQPPMEVILDAAERRSEEQRAAGRESGAQIIQEIRDQLIADQPSSGSAVDQQAERLMRRTLGRVARSRQNKSGAATTGGPYERQHADRPIAFYRPVRIRDFIRERDAVLARLPPGPDDTTDQRKERYFEAYIAPLWRYIDSDLRWDPTRSIKDNTETLFTKIRAKHAVCWRSVQGSALGAPQSLSHAKMLDSVSIHETPNAEIEAYLLKRLVECTRQEIEEHRDSLVVLSTRSYYSPVMPIFRTERTEELFADFCALVGILLGTPPTPRPWKATYTRHDVQASSLGQSGTGDKTSGESYSSPEAALQTSEPARPTHFNSHEHRNSTVLHALTTAVLHEIRANNPFPDHDAAGGSPGNIAALWARATASVSALQTVADTLARPPGKYRTSQRQHTLVAIMLSTPLFYKIRLDAETASSMWRQLSKVILIDAIASGLAPRTSAVRFLPKKRWESPIPPPPVPTIRLHAHSWSLQTQKDTVEHQLRAIGSALMVSNGATVPAHDTTPPKRETSRTVAGTLSSPSDVTKAQENSAHASASPVRDSASMADVDLGLVDQLEMAQGKRRGRGGCEGALTVAL